MAESQLVRLADESAVPPGEMILVPVGNESVLLVNLDGTVYALQGACSHEEYELDQGFLLGNTLTCALHGSRFDLVTGAALDPPAEQPLVRYAIQHRDGGLWLEVPAEGLTLNSDLR